MKLSIGKLKGRILYILLSAMLVFFAFICFKCGASSDVYDPGENTGGGGTSSDYYATQSQDIVNYDDTLSIVFHNDTDYSVTVGLDVYDTKGDLYTTSYTNCTVDAIGSRTFTFCYANFSGFDPGPNCRYEIYNSSGDGALVSNNFHTTVECNVDLYYVSGYNLFDLMADSTKDKFDDINKSLLIHYNFPTTAPITMWTSSHLNTPTNAKSKAAEYYSLSTSCNWKLFCLTTNPISGQESVKGFSVTDSVYSWDDLDRHEPHSNISERFAIVFMATIQSFAGNNVSKLQNFYWAVSAHELAHERFGLTDAINTNWAFHDSIMSYLDGDYVTHHAYCIMSASTFENYWNIANSEFIFCHNDFPTMSYQSTADTCCWTNALYHLYIDE